MKRYILAVIVLALMLGLLFQGLTSFAQEPQWQEGPRLPVQGESLCPSNGFIPPPMDLSHLTGQGMPNSFVSQAPPSSWDWRAQGKVTPVGDQGNCGSCYAFASIGNIESKMLIDGAGPYDFSENHAKECNWYETADFNGGTSCSGGNYFITANLFSKKGTVLESCDSYVDSDVDCKSTCPYQKTLLDWRVICGNVVPSTSVLKAYIQDYGPVYTTLYAGFPEFASYDGFYTLYYDGPEPPNHAVLIVGWDDTLTHAGGSGGWIVKNSWGTDWGGTCDYGSEKGYFTIAYESASIGMYSSSIYDWQDYDSSGGIMYYDEAGWTTEWGESGGLNTTLWGLCKFIPSSNTYVTRAEFWTTDITTDIDVYIYDNFDGTNLSNLLASKLNNSFSEAGYHSVVLDSPLAVTSGDGIFAVVMFTNQSYGFPVAADNVNPSHETGRTYIDLDGVGPWYDLGVGLGGDVAIRLRTSTLVTPPTVTTVNVRIEGENDNIWSGSVTVTESWITATNSSIEYHLADPTALGALDEASIEGEFTYETTDEWGGLFVTSIDGEEPEGMAGWMYRVDYFSPMVGADQFILDDSHQEVLFALCEWGEPPLKIEVNNTAPDAGDSFTVTVSQYDDALAEWFLIENATVYADTSHTTDENGEVEITIDHDATIDVYAEKDGYIRSNCVTVTVLATPWDYDANEDGVIDKSEAVAAVWDYFDGLITKDLAIEVLWLYFG